jgi:hypothetical protein
MRRWRYIILPSLGASMGQPSPLVRPSWTRGRGSFIACVHGTSKTAILARPDVMPMQLTSARYWWPGSWNGEVTSRRLVA